MDLIWMELRTSKSYSFQIKIISISDQKHIHFRSKTYPFQIKIISISDQKHIHFRSNLYPLHILVLLCVFPVFTPNPDFITPLFHGYYTKYISYSYPFQIKFISITYTCAALCISCSRLYSPSISWILNQIHIHYIYCNTLMSCSVFLFSLA